MRFSIRTVIVLGLGSVSLCFGLFLVRELLVNISSLIYFLAEYKLVLGLLGVIIGIYAGGIIKLFEEHPDILGIDNSLKTTITTIYVLGRITVLSSSNFFMHFFSFFFNGKYEGMYVPISSFCHNNYSNPSMNYYNIIRIYSTLYIA